MRIVQVAVRSKADASARILKSDFLPFLEDGLSLSIKDIHAQLSVAAARSLLPGQLANKSKACLGLSDVEIAVSRSVFLKVKGIGLADPGVAPVYQRAICSLSSRLWTLTASTFSAP